MLPNEAKSGRQGGRARTSFTILGLHSSPGGLVFGQKCCNWIALFDEPQAEAHICKKRDSDRSIGLTKPKGSPNQELTLIHPLSKRGFK